LTYIKSQLARDADAAGELEGTAAAAEPDRQGVAMKSMVGADWT
jgi:hypothetical protein